MTLFHNIKVDKGDFLTSGYKKRDVRTQGGLHDIKD